MIVLTAGISTRGGEQLKDQMLELPENFHSKAEEIIRIDLEKKSNIDDPYHF